MKKVLLFALAASAVASAQAASPMQLKPVMQEPTDCAVLKNHKLAIAKDSSMENKTFNSVSRVAQNDKYAFYPVYNVPSGAFSTAPITIGTKRFYAHHIVLPVYTDVTFQGDLLVGALTPSTTPDFDSWDKIAFNWTYPSYVPGKGLDIVSSSGMNATLQLPANITNYRIISPEMSISYEAVKDTIAYDISLQAGGRPTVVADGKVQTPGIFGYSTFYGNFADYDVCPDFYFGNGYLVEPGNDPDYPDGLTANTYRSGFMIQRYGKLFKQETGEDLLSTDLLMYAFSLGYSGAPYALSSLKFPIDYIGNGGKLTFRFCGMNEDGSPNQEDIIYSYTCDIPNTSGQEINHTCEIPFTSIDEYNEELSYIMVDRPLYVFVTGFEENQFFTPICATYDADDAHTNVEPYTCWAVVNLNGAATSLNGVMLTPGTYSHDGVVYTSTRAFAIEMDAEYPVLSPYAYQYGENFIESDSEAVHYFDFNKNGDYCVQLPKGESSVTVAIATSTEYVDEIYVDDSELPSWLDYNVEEIYEVIVDPNDNPNGVGEVVTGALITFTASGDYAARYGRLSLNYKNQNITLEVGQDGASSIENVTAAGNGSVTYFDLQGRKLNAAPAAGFFFQREGNKVTKVIR